jgi:16S rRNA processing protein RimM
LSNDYFTIAKISSAFGLDGGLKLHLVTDFPERIEKGRQFFVDINGFYRAVTVVSFSSIPSGKHGTVFFEGVNSRAEATALCGYNLVIPESGIRSVAKNLAPDSFLYCDLIGCDVLYNKTAFGSVAEVIEAGGGEILVVANEGREYMIPFVDEMVDTAEIASRRVTIYPVDGLLES